MEFLLSPGNIGIQIGIVVNALSVFTIFKILYCGNCIGGPRVYSVAVIGWMEMMKFKIFYLELLDVAEAIW